jgi:hypothetical protein
MDVENAVKRYFEHLGYTAEKIEEGTEQTPDFLVYDDSVSILVELKTKFPSAAEIAARQLMLDRGSIHNIHEVIIRKNTLSGITRHAAEQLKKYGAEKLLRIVFLLTVGHLAEPRFAQFEASLYGSTTIVDFAKGVAKDCYFFYESDFFRFRHSLDAAIVSTERDRALFLNPHSPRADQCRKSSLCDRFDGVVVDPIEREKQGNAYYVDGTLDRHNEDEVIASLKEKYHSQTLMKIDMNFLSGTMQYPAGSE